MSAIRTLTAFVLVFLLAACGSPKIPVPDPTPLTDFSQTAALNSSWESSEVRVSSKKSQAFVALRPILNGGLLIAASPEGEIIAINADSGSTVWKTELHQRIAAGMGTGSGIAVAVSSEGTVYALDVRDGAKLWEYQLAELIFAPPLVYRDLVVLRSIDGNLIALSAVSGEFLWDAIYDQPEFLEFGSAAPVGYQNTVIIGNATGRVIATELASGFDIWQLYLGSERSIGALRNREARPIVFRDHLILSDLSRAIVTYDLSTGNVLWENRRPSGRNVEVSESSVFGHNTDSLLFALNHRDGQLRWQQNAFLHRGIDDMALVRGQLVVSDAEGYLHVVDQATGEIIGRYRARERVASGGLLADANRLFIYYRSGRIQALTLQAAQE